jgi:hypothetical protein
MSPFVGVTESPSTIPEWLWTSNKPGVKRRALPSIVRRATIALPAPGARIARINPSAIKTV